MLTEVPSGYDVLVLSDTGAGFDLSEFSGRIIVTLDGGVAPNVLDDRRCSAGDILDFYTGES